MKRASPQLPPIGQPCHSPLLCTLTNYHISNAPYHALSFLISLSSSFLYRVRSSNNVLSMYFCTKRTFPATCVLGVMHGGVFSGELVEIAYNA